MQSVGIKKDKMWVGETKESWSKVKGGKLKNSEPKVKCGKLKNLVKSKKGRIIRKPTVSLSLERSDTLHDR